MRLSLFEINTIVSLKSKYFGENAKIYLFGSRIDDTKKRYNQSYLYKNKKYRESLNV